MIEATFQLAPGVGAYRERQLWAEGLLRWDALLAARSLPLGARLEARLRAAVEAATTALREGDAGSLAAMLPRRERWRLYRAFAEDTGYLDIETDGERVTVVGVLDRDGPRVFVRGRDLDAFPASTGRWKLLVTFNGLAFDVPVLQRAFPGWTPPRAHVDLRQLWGRLGHQGGLKLLERAAGVGRPDHLGGVDGREAVALWRRHEAGEPGALRRLAEYNLHDAVNLRSLMALGYNRMLERHRLPGEPVAPWHRGDVLCDMTRQVLAL